MICDKCGADAEELQAEGRRYVCWPWCGAEDTLGEARLIAAAPELRDALGLMTANCENVARMIRGWSPDLADAVDGMIADARAVLAKADAR